MEFVVSRGFALGSLERDLDGLVLSRVGFTSSRWAGGGFEVLASAPLPAYSAGRVGVFDGYVSLGGEFVHPLLDPGVDRMGVVARKLLRGDRPDGGVFCAGALGPDGGELRIDPLGQYPLHWWRRGAGFVVSNNPHLLEAVVRRGGVSLSRSLVPALDNTMLVGPLAGATLYDGVRALTVGQWLRFDDRGLELVDDFPAEAAEAAREPAPELVREVVAAMVRHVRSVAEAVPDAIAVADITGGSDSRAALAVVLASGVFPRLTGRCITKYPHPDANVAGLIMERLGLHPGPYPFAPGGSRVARQVADLKRSAYLHGGARDDTTYLTCALPDLVHFVGAFGEVGGASPGFEFMDAPDPPGARRFTGAAERVLERRARSGAAKLLTPDGLAAFAERLRLEIVRLVDTGVRPAQVGPEIWLRARGRTHFGLQNFLANQRMIRPDHLGLGEMTRLRRALPDGQSAADAVVLAIILEARPEIAFWPMVAPWSPALLSLVPEARRAEFESTAAVDRATPNLSGFVGMLTDLLRVEKWMGIEPYRSGGYPDVSDTRGLDDFPAARTVVGNQALLDEALDRLPAQHDCWASIDRTAVERAVAAPPTEFRTDTTARTLARMAMGLVWVAGAEVPTQVTETLSLREVLATRDAAARAALPPTASSAERGS